MNDIQNLIDRQLGLYFRFNYDNALNRLVVSDEESYYALQTPAAAAGLAPLDHDPPIFACRFAEARGFEHILALANEDGRVAIQDTCKVQGAGALEGFQCHNNAVFDLAWMPQHMSFVTVSGDHTACLWDVAEGAPKRVLMFSSHTKSVKTAVFRPTDPSVFATGARDGHILLWDIRTNNQPSSVILKPDNCLMNCHSSFTPKTPGSHGKRPRIDNQRAISITGLVFQDERTLLSCGECDGNIKVWDLRKNYSAYTREPLPKHSIPYCGSSTKNGYTNLIVDDARIKLYASCMDDVIYCFNISTYNALPEQRYVGHENRTFYIKTGLSPDGMYLVSGSSDKNAYIWNVRYSQPIVRLVGHRAEVTCASWRRAGYAAVVTCSDDARHKIWRVGPELFDTPVPRDSPGHAETVPREAVATLPPWGASDRTPNSLKRKMNTTPNSYAKRRAREPTSRKTKRCLTDSMNATRESDEDVSSKRIRLEMPSIAEEPRLLPAGTKRRREDADTGPVTPKKSCFTETEASSDWRYHPQAGSSFMTPTKNYEKRSCITLSPKSPKTISPGRSQVSPYKRQEVTFTTPTKNLPNFVLNGEAPHLRLMSPVRKKLDTTDWLTLMVRGKRGKPEGEKPASVAPLSPKENTPTRRTSVEKTPKANKKTGTLLKYFSVANKEK